MKQFARLFGACLLVLTASGQQRGVRVGLLPVGPISPLGGQAITLRHAPFFDHRSVFSRRGGSFPVTLPIYSGGYFHQEPSGPATVIVLQQPAPARPAVRETPPREVKGEIHEYGKAAPPHDDEQQAFAIVLKDGTVLSAIAVWVVGDSLDDIAPAGTRGHADLGAIDRGETRRRNQERKLHSPVPIPVRK